MSRRRGKRWVPASWLFNRCRRCNAIIPASWFFCRPCLAFLIEHGQGFL